ncbi:MAG: YIP1 family protein [Clostridia bacterium]|nr:YIP1 family protein [Clostridia bacterium]
MKKLTRIVVLLLSFVLLAGGVACHAAEAMFHTYTYSITGEVLTSPHAYTPDRQIDSYAMNLPESLYNPKDIFVDAKGNGYIYISDLTEAGEGRVVVCDPNFIYQYTISDFVNAQGVPDKLKSPEGLFIYENSLYVCDKENSRIVIFDTETRGFKDIIEAPKADVMGTDTVFRPVAVGVNASGTTYIVSDQTYSGVIALNPDGSFQAFLGAQKTSVPLAVRIRRMLFPSVVTDSFISTPYRNMTMDDEGQIWATIVFGTEEEKSLTAALQTLSTDATYAPIKRLNAKGDDIMVRNGFAMPAGEIMFSDMKDMTKETGPSELVDIAMGPNGMWSVVDSKRGKIYTYDMEGNLLFAFGDKGNQLGHLFTPVAITYCGSDILVLDGELDSIMVYKRTEYGNIIDQALMHNADREYTKAYNDWQDILRRNQNFDAAYVGIGKNLYRQGDYEQAMQYYQDAHETKNYSIAFQANRKESTEKSIGWIFVIAVVLIVALTKAMGYIGRKNKAGIVKVGKRTLWEEFLYGFYVIVHPFDGFWDLKHEKRGSVRGGLCILLLTVLAVVYNNIGSAYLFGGGGKVNIVGPMVSVLVLVALWVVANWCLTTLFDGEGNLKDIFVATCYALVPIPIVMIPATIATHFCSLAEAEFITLALGIAYVWTGLLILFGSMTTHGYSMGRNLAISFFTIIGMVFITFLAVLFWNLITRMISFVSDIITEISYRAD